MSYSVGSLVRARSREWVVLPESQDNFLILRPLGGTEDEITGIATALEPVEPARFDLPDPSQIGDYRSCREHLSVVPGADHFRRLVLERHCGRHQPVEKH